MCLNFNLALFMCLNNKKVMKKEYNIGDIVVITSSNQNFNHSMNSFKNCICKITLKQPSEVYPGHFYYEFHNLCKSDINNYYWFPHLDHFREATLEEIMIYNGNNILYDIY